VLFSVEISNFCVTGSNLTGLSIKLKWRALSVRLRKIKEVIAA
jgi:hypothetical protein